MKKNNFLILAVLILVVSLIVLGGLYLIKININFLALSQPEEIQQIRKRGRLTIGSDIPYGVMEFFDSSNKPAGIDIDIGEEIGKKLGVPVEFIDYDFDKLLAAVNRGEVDLAISSITITTDREKEMLFSIPYFNGGQVLVVGKDDDSIKLPEDLKDKKVGVQKETTGQAEAFKRVQDQSLVTSYDSLESEGSGKPEAVKDLESGKTEAIILDYIAALTMVKNNPGLKISGSPFTNEFYGVASAKSNSGLINVVNETLRNLKNSGKINEYMKKWI